MTGGDQVLRGCLHGFFFEVRQSGGRAGLRERRAAGSPMPAAAPVTSATLPLKSNELLIVEFRFSGGIGRR